MTPTPKAPPSDAVECCAHLHVSYRTQVLADGGTRGWWECDSGCGAQMLPAGLVDIEKDRAAENAARARGAQDIIAQNNAQWAKAGADAKHWNFMFRRAYAELVRCYETTGAKLGDAVIDLSLAGCVADTIHATTTSLRAALAEAQTKIEAQRVIIESWRAHHADQLREQGERLAQIAATPAEERASRAEMDEAAEAERTGPDWTCAGCGGKRVHTITHVNYDYGNEHDIECLDCGSLVVCETFEDAAREAWRELERIHAEPTHPAAGGEVPDWLDSPDLMEMLAAIEHARWSGWMVYQERCMSGADPQAHRDRWARQVRTEYADLSEREKESDRAEVRKTLAAIRAFLLAASAECGGKK